MNILDTQTRLPRILLWKSSAEAVHFPLWRESPTRILLQPLCNIARTLSKICSSTLVSKWKRAALLKIERKQLLSVTSIAYWLSTTRSGPQLMSRRLSNRRMNLKKVRTKTSQVRSLSFAVERTSTESEEGGNNTIKLADCFRPIDLESYM